MVLPFLFYRSQNGFACTCLKTMQYFAPKFTWFATAPKTEIFCQLFLRPLIIHWYIFFHLPPGFTPGKSLRKMAGYPLKDASKYVDARAWADSVIQSGEHSLNPDYKQIFINHSADL